MKPKNKDVWMILVLTFLAAILLHLIITGGMVKNTTPPKLSQPHEGKDTQLIVKTNVQNDRFVDETENVDGEWETFEATAYLPTCKGCSGITYSGYDVRNTMYYNDLRVIATDLDVIPLYSIVEIKVNDNRIFKAIALDVGSDIQGYRIDVLMHDYEKAMKFGRRDVQIRVIEWGEVL